jgi:hypothetical protein
MQTFLPYRSFEKSARALDNKRLGNQRVEAHIILKILEKKRKSPDIKIAWGNHPAVLMWEGYEEALKEYYNTMVRVWKEKGFRNSMKLFRLSKNITYPGWLNSRKFHASHRSNLLRKNKEFYLQYKWTQPDNLPYVWPVRKNSK